MSLERALRLRSLLAAALLGAAAAQAAPLAFEQNLGQTDPKVSYFGRTADGMLFLTPDEIVLKSRRPSFRSIGWRRRRPKSGSTCCASSRSAQKPPGSKAGCRSRAAAATTA
jgi:hypothetical protein